MKNIILALVVVALAGCATYITPSGTYIEPLPEVIVIGPPVVVAPPPAVVVRPLPPVVVVPDRHLYYYGNYYYYHWNDNWYWSRAKRGPWHDLPRKSWPQKMERRDRGKPHRERDRY